MKKQILTCIACLAIAALLATLAAPLSGQSLNLVELKKKEEERRKKAEGSKYSVSDENLKSIDVKSKKYSFIQLEESDVEDDSQAAQPPAGTDPADETRTEAFWRNQKNEIEERIAFLEQSAEEQQLQLNQLWTDFYLTDSFIQQNEMRARIDQLTQQLETSRLNLERARKELADLQERARRAGIPPGWLR